MDKPKIDDETREALDKVLRKMQEIINHNPEGVDPVVMDEKVELSRAARERADDERRRVLRESMDAKWAKAVPPLWADWTIDRLPGEMQIKANDWVANFGNDTGNLLLLGSTGSGKTSMAYAIARALFITGRSTRVYEVSELIAGLRPEYENIEAKEASKKLFERVKDADLLVLDDLRVEKMTPFTEEKLFGIANHRTNWKKRTIITSNLSLTELEERLTQRIFFRLIDNATPIILTGVNHRELKRHD